MSMESNRSDGVKLPRISLVRLVVSGHESVHLHGQHPGGLCAALLRCLARESVCFDIRWSDHVFGAMRETGT